MNVYFHTFGCKANQYDTALVQQALVDRGAVVVDDPRAADLAVVNSCTVTHEAEVKLRRLVRRLARENLETVVMGCAAARDDGTIAALPRVRAVVGGADVTEVLRASGLSPSPPSSEGRGGQGVRTPGVRTRGLLKIQDGCDEHCTFCATTLARGANRSRPIPELVEEARALAAHHAEIVLTGVHIGTYGRDRSPGWTDPGAMPRGQLSPPGSGAPQGECSAPRGHRERSPEWTDPGAMPRGQLSPPGSGAPQGHTSPIRVPVNPGAWPRGWSTLGTLLEALIAAVPQVRFRLSSIEATEVDDTIARLLIEAPRHLAAHLHAPLQSGSDRVLKRMGRHWYTADAYRARLEWLAARMPLLGLGADIIAGFPGETDADHRATLALVEALPFTYLHVFPYSERPGAAAARLGAPVAPGVIRRRARDLRELGERKAAAYRAARQGGRGDGVVSGRSNGKVEVLTQDYLSVYVPTGEWDGTARFEVTIS